MESMQKPVASSSKGSALVAGLFVCLLIAVVAWLIPYYKIVVGISALLWAFVISIIATNLVRMPERLKSGIQFSSTRMLRFSVAALGFTISVGAWTAMGVYGLLIVFLVMALAFSASIWLGKKFGLSRELSLLIGVGTCICGASAIAATGAAIKAKESEMGLALACITLFGLAAMVLYPFLFTATAVGQWLHNSQASFGVWAGVGIHEMAQVLAAGYQVGVTALNVATVTKSIRVFLIGPVILLVSYFYSRAERGGEGKKVYIPWYAVVFVLGTIINSVLLNLPAATSAWSVVSGSYLQPAVIFLLATAFAGVGFKVKYESIAKVGLKAFAIGLICALVASVFSLFLVIAFL